MSCLTTLPNAPVFLDKDASYLESEKKKSSEILDVTTSSNFWIRKNYRLSVPTYKSSST